MSIQERAANDVKRFLLIKNQEGKEIRWKGKMWDPEVLLDEIDRDSHIGRQIVMGREITLLRKRSGRRRWLACLAGAIVLVTGIVLMLL